MAIMDRWGIYENLRPQKSDHQVSKNCVLKRNFDNGSRASAHEESSPEDWDFLTKLNDILKSENFLSDDSVNRNITANNGPIPPHYNYRPPRPARRSDRRKADFLKARSMDAGDGIKLLDYSNPPVLSPPKCVYLSRSNLTTSLDSIYDKVKGRRLSRYIDGHFNGGNSSTGESYPFGLNCGDWSSRTSPFQRPHNFYRQSVHPEMISSNWFGGSRYGSKGSLLGLDEDRLLRLESDKESLHLQVSVLSDQIDAQTMKISDLEKLLDDKRNVLESTEDSLQRELLTRSSLETQKLELLTEISSLRLKQASLERENFELKDRIGGRLWDKPPMGTQNSLIDSATGGWSRGTSGGGSPQRAPARPKTPPASAYRRVEQSSFGTIPRRTPSMFNNGTTGHTEATTSSGNLAQFSTGSKIINNNPISYQLQLKPLQGSRQMGPGVVPGYYLPSSGAGLYFASDTRSTSAPNLALIEREDWERRNKKSPVQHKSRGILRILGKLKRSNSSGLENGVAPAETSGGFVRGGLRWTATPRLGWVKDMTLQKPDGPVTGWDSNNVILWLNYLGLGLYGNEVKRWVKTGQQLLDASPQELEKELGIKNTLHRKKLNLALNALKHPEEDDSAGKLDYHWVIRWLDDVGLPQYKETFAEARVDGRVLSHMTADDLFLLKVTSVLHHSSIKRGIQLLRIHKFHPGCLCRRGGPVHFEDGAKNVATWTNHRVMEWLKAIDLAEYAPNLRGSGVHGALIIFEPKFNAELLSTLLSIPGNKTLLRRHLSLQVNELVGRVIVQEKRVVELGPDFIPISPTVKVKQPKSSKGFLRGKRLSSEGPEELLCPLDLDIFPFRLEIGMTSMENSDGMNGGEKVSNI